MQSCNSRSTADYILAKHPLLLLVLEEHDGRDSQATRRKAGETQYLSAFQGRTGRGDRHARSGHGDSSTCVLQADQEGRARSGLTTANLFRGGDGGIRTHETCYSLPDYKSGAFDRSATSPQPLLTTSRGCLHPCPHDFLSRKFVRQSIAPQSQFGQSRLREHNFESGLCAGLPAEYHSPRPGQR